jgi:NAD(P)-dependent dehydrogenase (short-subunit alcohol dehydrogenase family)
MARLALANAVVPEMIRQGWVRIINVTTRLGTMLNAGSPTYGPSKAALEALSAIMAKDLDGTGVTVRGIRRERILAAQSVQARCRSLNSAGRGLAARDKPSALLEEILDTLSPQELGRLPESVWALPDFMPSPTTPRRERDYRERENPKAFEPPTGKQTAEPARRLEYLS